MSAVEIVRQARRHAIQMGNVRDDEWQAELSKLLDLLMSDETTRVLVELAALESLARDKP